MTAGPPPSPARQRRSRATGEPTISDVARLAGVSNMTVSRVLNGEANVSAGRRDAVKAAVAELNYSPNPAARSLAGAAQLRLGLLYSNPSSGFLSEFLLGVLDEAARANVQIVIEKCEGGDSEVEVARHLAGSNIDGVVLPPPICERGDILRVFDEAGIPAAAVATGLPDATPLSVRIDDHAAAMTMTRHILSLGHRRIGFIRGNADLSATDLRLAGFGAALEESGCVFDPALVADGRFTYKSGLDAAEQLLSLDPRPTAIFSSNDEMAAATVAVAHRMGIDVPGQLTICGFDDTLLATTIWPELTTIRQPIADMARSAVELLVARLRDRGGMVAELAHRVLEATLVRRQSDAVPRSRPRTG